MKYILGLITGAIITTGILAGGFVLSAPQNSGNIFRNITPEKDDTYYNATSSIQWKETHSDEYCIDGVCIDNWDSIGVNNWEVNGSGQLTPSTTISVYVPADLIFDGEIKPDGDTCANGQILKKIAANDWDCVDIGGGWATTSEAYYWSVNFPLEFASSYNSTTTLNGFTDNSTNWNTAYGWGDHSVAGYLAQADWESTTTDALAEGLVNFYYTDVRVADYVNGSSTLPTTSYIWDFSDNTNATAGSNIEFNDDEIAVIASPEFINLTVTDTITANTIHVVYTTSTSVVVTGNTTSTGYLSVGADDGNFNFTAGDLNASGDLYIGGNATTTGHTSLATTTIGTSDINFEIKTLEVADVLGLGAGRFPYIMPNGSVDGSPFTAAGLADRLAFIDTDEDDEIDLLFTDKTFTNAFSINVNVSDNYFMMGADVIPDGDLAFDLGSPTYRWSESRINLMHATSTDFDDLQVNGDANITGILTGNNATFNNATTSQLKIGNDTNWGKISMQPGLNFPILSGYSSTIAADGFATLRQHIILEDTNYPINNPVLLFANSTGADNSLITYTTSTDFLAFLGATKYLFDNDVLISGDVGIATSTPWDGYELAISGDLLVTNKITIPTTDGGISIGTTTSNGLLNIDSSGTFRGVKLYAEADSGFQTNWNGDIYQDGLDEYSLSSVQATIHVGESTSTVGTISDAIRTNVEWLDNSNDAGENVAGIYSFIGDTGAKGASIETYGIRASNFAGATTTYAGYFEASGKNRSVTSTAIYATATGGTNTYSGYFAAGDVYIEDDLEVNGISTMNDDLTMVGSTQINFNDSSENISSPMGSSLILQSATLIGLQGDVIGHGTNNNIDTTMFFYGASNDGQFDWMEDEDYFAFRNDVIFDENVTTTKSLYIGDDLTVSDKLNVGGLSTLATTTMSMGSKIQDTDASYYFTVEGYDFLDPGGLGASVTDIPLIVFNNSSEILTNSGGVINKGLFIMDDLYGTGSEDDDMPEISFASRDILDIFSGASSAIEYNTTTDKLYFTDAVSYHFDKYILQEGIFGEIAVADNSDVQSIPTGATYTKITEWDENGMSANTTPDHTQDSIRLTIPGTYRIAGSFSFGSGTNNVTWRGSAFVAGVEIDHIHFKRKTSVANDSGSASFTGYVTATSSTEIDTRIRHDNGSSVNLILEYANLNIEYIGN